jgi:hypothetical protein
MKSMATQKLTYVSFADIIKTEKSEDGLSIKVFGKATDETLDGDGQKVDLAWASKALERWLGSGGNIRVQHNPNLYPAGVGIELDVKSDGAYVTADIVEPTAMRLVEKGALRAFSIGISNPKIVRDATAPHGRINGGEIPELSIVDRPSNPSCGVKVMKGGDGEFAMDTWDSGEDATIEKKKGDQSDPDNDAGNDIPDGTGDTDSDDSGSGGDNGDGNKPKKKKKNKVDNGDQLWKSPRRGRGQEGAQASKAVAQGGDNQDEGAHGESDQRAVKVSDDASDASSHQRGEVEKLDLTGETIPVVTEVEKRERQADGTWGNRSNPTAHDPSHHDSTDPQKLAGADTYAGQAVTTTPQGDAVTTAHDVAVARAATHESTLPDAIPPVAEPPAVQDAAATKAAKKLRKAQKKLRQQAKQLKKLRKQARIAATPEGADIPTIDRWNEIIAKNAKLAEEKATLEDKLEKISSQPTLGKAIRAPERVRAPIPAVSAEAQKSAQDTEFAERVEFLEGVATAGNPAQQDAARDLLQKLRNTQLNK